MKKKSDIIACAQQVLLKESKAVSELIPRIGNEFKDAVNLILNSKGRIIVTGIGKSGIIAQKIAATLTSTGTSALFLHPAEGVHGDLGLVLKNDIIICISKSGNTGELTRLFPVFRKIGVPIITFTGNLRSALAERSDIVLDVSVAEEACPNDLAPTASTTAALAMGDALAVALLEQRKFKPEDFAFLHPGGDLGRQLTTIEEVMFKGDKVPKVYPSASIPKVILEMTKKRFGCTCVVSDEQKLVGIITDGDLRRLIRNQVEDVQNLKASDIMNENPKTIKVGNLAISARKLMENFNIMQAVIVDEENHPIGMVHLHDLLEAGIKEE
jgi:arabinose-5-phosphate isomerase